MALEIKLPREQARDIIFSGYQEDEKFSHLRKSAKQFVPGVGPMDADVMFVGEAPGGREDSDGKPFVGPSGELLHALLGSVGLRRSQVYISNIVKYRPEGNRTPTPAEVEDSLTYFQSEWSLVEPSLTVLLGKTSTVAVGAAYWPGMKMGEIVGKPLLDQNGYWFLPMWHPAYILRQRHLRTAYIESFEQAYWQVFEKGNDHG